MAGLLAGGASGAFFANHWPFFGLVERINIGTLQAWTFALSLVLFRGSPLLPAAVHQLSEARNSAHG